VYYWREDFVEVYPFYLGKALGYQMCLLTAICFLVKDPLVLYDLPPFWEVHKLEDVTPAKGLNVTLPLNVSLDLGLGTVCDKT